MYTHWAHMKGNLSQRRSLLHTDHYYTQIITTHRSLLHTDHYYTQIITTRRSLLHTDHYYTQIITTHRSLLHTLGTYEGKPEPTQIITAHVYIYTYICTRTFVPTNVHIHSYIRKPEPTQIVTVHAPRTNQLEDEAERK